MSEERKKIRILQSLDSLGIGGNEVFVMNFFRHIDKKRFQIDFIIYNDSAMDFYDEIIASGSTVYVCKSNNHNRYLDILVKIIKVRKILIKNKYNIIHCHGCSFMGIFRGAIAGHFAWNVKVISHSHNSGILKNTLLDKIARILLKKYLSKIVDLGFACSDIAAKNKYTDEFMKTEKFSIINNSIDINKFLFNKDIRKEMRNKYKINDEIIIGNIGRLEEQKNQKFLLKIFLEIKKRSIPAKLIIVGDGVLNDNLHKYAFENGIENDVIFTGKVSDSNNYYQMMDIFVLTSIYEGFPFVMVEAQVNGLSAVVSSNITKSVNISGDVKFMPLEENEEEWADIILKSKRKWNDNLNCKNIFRNYDLEYQARTLENYYTTLLIDAK